MVIVSLCLGRYSINPVDVLKILLSRIIPIEATWNDTMEGVVFSLRLPRIAAALLIGGALALSGAAYQGVFKNPLVSPYFLGVSSGASVGAALMILAGTDKIGIQLGAFLGGIIAVGVATTIPKLLKNTGVMILVLSGIIVGGIMNSFLGLIKYLADPENELAEIVYWQMGSLAKVHLEDFYAVFPAIAITTVILIAMGWRINILSLGENEARSLGINTGFNRSIVIFCATVLTASAVSISGTIGWIGLVMPHLGRMLVGPDNVRLLPVSFIIGSGFLLLIDTIARVATSAALPLSILTGIIGAPFYFWLLVRQRMRI